MGLGELLRASLESIRAHKLRSFLTLLGIIIGVTTVVAVASVISGLNAYVRDKVIQLSPDVFVVTKFGVITSRDEFLAAIKRPDFTTRDYQKLAGLLANASAIGADVGTGSAVKHKDKRLGTSRCTGAPPTTPASRGSTSKPGGGSPTSTTRAPSPSSWSGGTSRPSCSRTSIPWARRCSSAACPFASSA